MQSLEDAIIRLLKGRPFYGQFLLQFRRRPVEAPQAAGATISDGVPTLLVDARRFALFSRAEQQALLEHLIKHILHLHPCRRRAREPRRWDLACDLAINPGISGLPPEAVLPERFGLPEQLAAEEYYARLPQLPRLGAAEGDGVGEEVRSAAGRARPRSGADAGHLPETLDDHDCWQEADRTPQPLAEQVVRQLVQNAWQKCHGEVPGELAPLLAPFLAAPAIPWQQILRQFVASAGRVGSCATWQRPHRRFARHSPGTRKERRLHLAVAVDVSDSTDTRELRESFARELLQIARGRQSRISLLYAGSRIQKIEQFSGAPQVCEVYRGGGFTDLRPAFAYARQLQPRPAALIYLTDGYGPAPEQTDLPTLWVISPGGKKPVDWGLELSLSDCGSKHGPAT